MKAFRLLVNRSATWADWDDALLKLELEDLQGLDFDLEMTGFDAAEIETLLSPPTAGLTDENAVPEAPKVATTVPGERVDSGLAPARVRRLDGPRARGACWPVSSRC